MVEPNFSSKNNLRGGASNTRNIPIKRRKAGGKRPFISTPLFIFFSFLALIVVAYFALMMQVFQHHSTISNAGPPPLPLLLGNTTSFGNNKKRARYQDWKELAVQLAALPADQILATLKTQDPFGVRQFEEKLKQAESDRQAILQLEDIRRQGEHPLFPCPVDERITLPDQRDHQRSKKYREGLNQLKTQNKEEFVFLFFQHLRKAGGTNFCTLAEHNLLRAQVPSYFCMPDFQWSKKKCAGCLLKFSNEEMVSNMFEAGHRILGNEWDNFADRFFDLPAVFATSFRRPLDRALSQFRFECIEDRGCKFKNVEPWWKKRTDLTNVYTWTFSGSPIRKISVGKTAADAKKRQEAIAKALDTVAKYDLVMVMEWLAYAPEHVRDVLGFRDTTTMTERIRPHIGQAKRNDGQEHNQLGAAGIAKASWTPEEYLSAEQYKIMSEDLALDEILTDAARRMFLERIVCDDMSEDKFTTTSTVDTLVLPQ